MEIKEYALKVLAEHECDIHTYGNYPVSCEELTSDLREAYPNGMPFDYADVAKTILEISAPDCEHIPGNGFSFEYWGKWAVYDLYDDAREELQSALDAGSPFDSGWRECVKELQEMRVARDCDKTIVQCRTYMDSALEETDLIYDCLEDDEVSLLTDAHIDEIRDLLIDSGFTDEGATCAETLSPTASLGEILEASKRVLESSRETLDESFRECIACTLWVIYGASENTDKLIANRINKLCPNKE